MGMIVSKVKAFIADEDGVTAIEYGLIAALIGVVIVASAGDIGTRIKKTFEFIRDSLPANPGK
ncbi:Flp family type IVb pilin [Massilia oculi]|uniref:Flp family type IVb pilin n=1 Tax=Massilia hydrophila TaxID=3044279 RepID=A0ABS7Y875_9BURK|nr:MULTISPECIES: Flp family type IVb pilin [Massilia]MCA1245519.1 Flp family type IVb pilin [Massilia sp. MS-15]MCA1855888.1 Flp family type IVb pilin [Massilia oculi]